MLMLNAQRKCGFALTCSLVAVGAMLFFCPSALASPMEGETQIGNPLSTIYLDSTSTYGGLVWDGSHLIVGEMTGGHYELDTLNSNGSISSG